MYQLYCFVSIQYSQQASILLGKLKQALDQPDVHSAVKPSMDALIKPSLLKHQDEDVRLLVIKCICEIIRIGAPDAPFSDDTLKVAFNCNSLLAYIWWLTMDFMQIF